VQRKRLASGRPAPSRVDVDADDERPSRDVADELARGCLERCTALVSVEADDQRHVARA
jgi:hypothetical protein